MTDRCKNITFPQLLLRTVTSFMAHLHFHCAFRFRRAHWLAHMLDSLVRVSRRVGRAANRFATDPMRLSSIFAFVCRRGHGNSYLTTARLQSFRWREWSASDGAVHPQRVPAQPSSPPPPSASTAPGSSSPTSVRTSLTKTLKPRMILFTLLKEYSLLTDP